jgi:predicted ATPase
MATLDLVAEVATDAPLLLVIEDVHWLDRPTSNVLAFVARRLESDPIVLLAATRDGYPSVLADVGLPEVGLARLDDATATALLDASAPELPLAMRGRVLREAAGNPLALLELPAVMSRQLDEQWVQGALPLTERLERAFAARVSELPEASRLVLLVASLSDEDMLDEILAAAGAIAGSAVDLDAAGPAVDAGIVDLDLHSVRFRHPLIRSAVAQSASLGDRRRVHEALAVAAQASQASRWAGASVGSGRW